MRERRSGPTNFVASVFSHTIDGPAAWHQVAGLFFARLTPSSKNRRGFSGVGRGLPFAADVSSEDSPDLVSYSHAQGLEPRKPAAWDQSSNQQDRAGTDTPRVGWLR